MGKDLTNPFSCFMIYVKAIAAGIWNGISYNRRVCITQFPKRMGIIPTIKKTKRKMLVGSRELHLTSQYSPNVRIMKLLI